MRALLLAFLYVVPLATSKPRKIDIYSQKHGDIRQLFAQSDSPFRNAIPRNSEMKWTATNGIVAVPYQIKGVYTQTDIDTIHGALAKIQQNACVRFLPYQKQRDYISFINKANEGCYSTVGRVYGENIISLESNAEATCVHTDIVVHEILHSLGLWHEHMRYDRDSHVTVNYDNIAEIFWRQFSKISKDRSDTYSIPYDYRSIMHYTKSAFAKNGDTALVTLEPKEKGMLNVIGKSSEPSQNDWLKVCHIYQCPTCMGRATSPIVTTPQPTVKTSERKHRLEQIQTQETKTNSRRRGFESACIPVSEENRSSDPNGRQIQFLIEFADFLQTWQDSGKKGLLGGLTGDTFRAVRHTCRAMVELARYCLEGLGWEFVMLGHCSSDRLEGHFSAYRQTHGGNFLIGVKQILESEKKLRAISLLRYSKCSLNDLKDLQGIDTVRSATALTIAKDLSPRVEEALTSTPREPNNTDLNIILYVSGAMVRSHISCTKGCGPCQRLLLNNGGGEQMPNLSTDGKVAPAVAEFIEQVNRGGLLVPSSLAFGLGMKAWIKKDEELRAEFLKATNHRAIFVETVLNLIEDESEIEEVLINELTCAEGHNFGRVLITKFFHCMVKNWTKEMSTAVPEKKGTQRKVAKLTSQTAK